MKSLMKKWVLYISIFSFCILILIFVYYKKTYYISEAEYHKIWTSRCIVNDVGRLLKLYYDIEKKYPYSNLEYSKFVLANKDKILCGPEFLISSQGNIVDAYGDSIIYVNEKSSAVVYSINVPYQDLISDKYYYGVRVDSGKVIETRIEKVAQ